jgi:hypothetical protein
MEWLHEDLLQKIPKFERIGRSWGIPLGISFIAWL